MGNEGYSYYFSILESIEIHTINNLCSFTTTKEIWECLKHIYYQDNNARRFQLKLEIANYTKRNLTIEQYYSSFFNLWSEYSDIIHAKVLARPYPHYKIFKRLVKGTSFLWIYDPNLKWFEQVYWIMIRFLHWMYIWLKFCMRSNKWLPKLILELIFSHLMWLFTT